MVVVVIKHMAIRKETKFTITIFTNTMVSLTAFQMNFLAYHFQSVVTIGVVMILMPKAAVILTMITFVIVR